MKKLLFISLCFTFINCKSKNDSFISNNQHSEKPQNRSYLDSIDKANFDTSNLHTSPIQIISCTIEKEDGFNIKGFYTIIVVKFKNISGKKINGIRFKWKALDAFNEPVIFDREYENIGFGNGVFEESINDGSVSQAKFKYNIGKPTKLAALWPKEVGFANGEIWEASK